MGQFLVFPIPAVTFNFQNHSFIPAYPLSRYVGLILIFLEDPLWDCAHVHGATWLKVCLFHHSATFTRNAIDAVPSVMDLLLAWFCWLNSKECVNSKVYPNVIMIQYMFELFRNTQWFRLALSNGPSRVGVFPLTWGCKQIQFLKHCVLLCSVNTSRWTKSRNSVILGVIHHQ
jgi:hypothetical protein